MSIDHKDFDDIWGASLSTSRGIFTRVRADEKMKLFLVKRQRYLEEKDLKKRRRSRQIKYQINS